MKLVHCSLKIIFRPHYNMNFTVTPRFSSVQIFFSFTLFRHVIFLYPTYKHTYIFFPFPTRVEDLSHRQGANAMSAASVHTKKNQTGTVLRILKGIRSTNILRTWTSHLSWDF